jgi:hypothetical protein
VPKGLGRCPQRDDPSYSGSTTQEYFIHKEHDTGISGIPEEIGRSPQRDDPLCSSGTAQEKFRQKNRSRNDVARRASRERTTEKRRRMNPEGYTDIKDPGARRRLRLRSDKTAGRLCGRTNEKVIGLESAKQIAGSPVPLQKNKDWSLWRGRLPSKRKKEQEVEEESVM